MLDADCVIGGTRLGQLCVVKLRFFAVSETKARVAWSAAVKQILYWLVSNGDHIGKA